MSFVEMVQCVSASAHNGNVCTFWSNKSFLTTIDNAATIEQSEQNILSAKRGKNARAPKNAAKFLDWLNK